MQKYKPYNRHRANVSGAPGISVRLVREWVLHNSKHAASYAPGDRVLLLNNSVKVEREIACLLEFVKCRREGHVDCRPVRVLLRNGWFKEGVCGGSSFGEPTSSWREHRPAYKDLPPPAPLPMKPVAVQRRSEPRVPVSRPARVGQTNFRANLISRYGTKCLVTGCTAADAIDAAHLIPFSTGEIQDPSNGLLLRSDIHKLFDRGLIGIDADLIVHLCPTLKACGYDDIDGARLRCDAVRPSEIAIRFRWNEFRRGLGGEESL